MKKLPIGIQDFRKLREQEAVYIDKTELIYKLVTEGEYYFLSRPRRFGKSLLVNTMKELFLGSKELFEGLFIEDKWDWEQKHPIIHLPFASMGYREIGLEKALIKRVNDIALSYQLELKKDSLSLMFHNLIVKLDAKYGKVVILVDEYDKPIIDYIGKDLELAQENQKTMKTFYSVLKDLDKHLRLLFITGVSRFSKVSIFSDLNNLNDITIKKKYTAIAGYTEEDIKSNFADYIQLLMEEEELDYQQTIDKIREWYNGYSWGGKVRLYNPFGVLNLFDGLEFRSYWFATATPSFLIDILKNQVLYNVDGIETGERVFESFKIEDDINPISLLFQTGYLTIKSQDREAGLVTLGYPNREVKIAFTEHLLGAFSGQYSTQWFLISKKLFR